MPDGPGAKHAGRKSSVLVVGAGPTGLVLAGELARHGIDCRLIERRTARQERSKAITLQARTLEIFEDLGIIDEVLDRGASAHNINWYSWSGAARHATTPVRLAKMPNGLPSPYPIQHNLHQHETELLLEQRATGYGVRIERGIRFTSLAQDPNGVIVQLRDEATDRVETTRFDWVLGCDGVDSTVRESVGLSFEGTPYPESHLLADVRIDWDMSHDEGQVLLSPHGTLMCMPLSDQRWRIVADLDVKKDGGQEPQPTIASLQQLLDRRGAHGAVLREIEWFSVFRLERRMVDRFRVGRVFVLGDAAHVHSAVLNQGMNTGIGDAYNLGWKLALVANGLAHPELLDSFQWERHATAKLVLRNSHTATRMVGIRGRTGNAARARVLHTITKSETFQRLVRESGSQINFRYAASHLLSENGKFGRRGPRPGMRAPYVMFGPDSDRGRSFDLLYRGRHVLLLFAAQTDPNAYRRLAELATLARTRAPGALETILVIPEPRRPRDTYGAMSLRLDPHRELHSAFGARTECLYLVRPDGYVAYRAAPADPNLLAGYLDRLFMPAENLMASPSWTGSGESA